MVSADKLAACLFNSSGRCGYHNDLSEHVDMFFQWDEDSTGAFVAAASSTTPSYRQLIELEAPTSTSSKSIQSTLQQGRISVEFDAPVGMTLPSENIEVSKNEDAILFLSTMLETVTDLKTAIPNAIIWSIGISWEDESPWLDASMAGASSINQVGRGHTQVIWRLFGISPIVRVRTKADIVGQAEMIVTIRVKGESGFMTFQKLITAMIYEPMPTISLDNGLLPFDSDAIFTIGQSLYANYAIGMIIFNISQSEVLVRGVNKTSSNLTRCDLDYCEYVLYECNTLKMDCVVTLTPKNSRRRLKVAFFAMSAVTPEGKMLSVENSMSEKMFELYWISETVTNHHIDTTGKPNATLKLHQLIEESLLMVDKTPLQLHDLSIQWNGSVFDSIAIAGKQLAVKSSIYPGHLMSTVRYDDLDSLLTLDLQIRHIVFPVNSWNIQVKFDYRHPRLPSNLYALVSNVHGSNVAEREEVSLFEEESKAIDSHAHDRRLNEHPRRELESHDLSITFKPWPVTLYTLYGSPLKVHFPTFFEGITGVSCDTTITVFDKTHTLQTVSSVSFGVVNISQTQRHSVVHNYSAELEFDRAETAVSELLFSLQINVMDGQGVINYRIDLPIIWKLFSQPALFSMTTFSVGPTEVSIGAAMRFQVAFDGIATNRAKLDIVLSDCDQTVLSLVLLNQLQNISSRVNSCFFTLSKESLSESTTFPLEFLISRQSYNTGKLGVQVTLTHESNADNPAWQSSRSVLSHIEFHVCQAAFSSANDFYVLDKELQVYDTGNVLSRIFPSRQLANLNLTSVLFVWNMSDESLIGNFSTNGSLLSPMSYNDTAMFVSVDISRSSSFSYEPSDNASKSGFLLDIIAKWTDEFQQTGCTFRSNLRVTILPRTVSAVAVPPYSFSRKIYQGLSLNVSLPYIEAAYPTVERIEVDIYLNSSGPAFNISNNGSPLSAKGTSDTTFVIASRDSIISVLNNTVITVSPQDEDFIGTTTFDFVVTSYNANRSSRIFEDMQSSISIVYSLSVQWVSLEFTSEAVPSSGLAIYRSIPLPIENNSTLTFEYRFSSGTTV